MVAPSKYWRGSPPTKCELCEGPLVDDEMVDGRIWSTKSWGLMCVACHDKHGVGHGTGFGQKYKKQADGRWLKVAGGGIEPEEDSGRR